MNDSNALELPAEHGGPAGPATSRLATASLILAVFGIPLLSILAGIPALILGIVALLKIQKSRGVLAGYGPAIGGIVLGILSILFFPSFQGIVIQSLIRTPPPGYQLQCAQNLKQLFTCAMEYGNRKGTRSFPYSPKGSIASLQEMIDFDSEGLPP